MSNPPMSDAVRHDIAQQDNHPLKGFAVIYEQKVEWGDMDAFNHVNNVVYYDYAQRARIHYLQQVDMFNLNLHRARFVILPIFKFGHFPRCALDWHSCQKNRQYQPDP